MSQKAWMNAYTKGSKSMQARLAKVHANNPEFQEFVKKHGFGGNLSVKQSGLQKKTLPPEAPKPTAAKGGDQNREQMIKDIATKLRNRRLAASNRASFGGELGGDFSMHSGGFRRYSESVELDESKAEEKIKAHPGVSYYGGKSDDHFVELKKGWAMDGQRSFGNKSASEAAKMLKHVKQVQATDESVDEDIAYKDGAISMRRGGWIAKRGGKQVGIIHPTEELAKAMLDNTRLTLGRKIGDAIRKKAKDVARSLDRRYNKMATESAANRNRIRSWDSAVLPVEHDHPLHTPHPKAKLDALRAAGKHIEARELERSWLRKSMAKEKPPFTPDKPKNNPGIVAGKNDPSYSRARHLARLGLKKAMEQGK
jgi:hypothetical protein